MPTFNGKKIAQRIRDYAEKHKNAYRPQQIETAEALADHLEKGGKGGQITAATGTGKSFSQVALGINAELPSVIITSRKIIGKQTHGTYLDEEFPFNVDPDDVGVYDSDQSAYHKPHALNKPYLVTTHNSFMRLVADGKISPEPKHKAYRGALMIDEAHNATGEAFPRHLRPFREKSLITSWSATDTFPDGTTISERLFGTPDRIYHLPLREAVGRGLLTNAIYTEALVVDEDLSAMEKMLSSGRDYNENAQRLFENYDSMREYAAKYYAEYEHPRTGIRLYGKPVIVTTHSIKGAQKAAEVFNAHFGHGTAEWVSGDMPPGMGKPEGIINAHRNGAFPILCAAQITREGYDNPDVTGVISIDANKSPISTGQTLGRGTRKQRADYVEKYGDEKVTIAVNIFGRGMRPYTFRQFMNGAEVEAYQFAHHSEGKGKKTRTGGRPHFVKQPGEFEKLPPAIIHRTAEDFEAWDAEGPKPLPPAPEGFVYIAEFMRDNNIGKSAGSTTKLRRLYQECEDQYDPQQGGEQTARIGDQLFRCGMFAKGDRRQSFCVHQDDIKQLGFKTINKDLTPPPAHMLNWTDFTAKAGHNNTARSFFRNCEKTADKGKTGEQTIRIDDKEIQCGWYRKGSRVFFCIDEKQTASLKNKIDVKTEDMLLQSDAERLSSKHYIGPLYSHCRKKYDKITGGEQTIEFDGQDFRCGLYYSSKVPALYIQRADVEQYTQSLSQRTPAPKIIQATTAPVKADMMTLSDCRQQLGIKEQSPEYHALKRLFTHCRDQLKANPGTTTVEYMGEQFQCCLTTNGNSKIHWNEREKMLRVIDKDELYTTTCERLSIPKAQISLGQ